MIPLASRNLFLISGLPQVVAQMPTIDTALVGYSHPSGAGESLAKLRVLSTHLFMNERLRSGLLEVAVQSGAQAVEIFAARQHFDYTSREHVADLAPGSVPIP